MDNLWLWLLGAAALVVLGVALLPRLSKPASAPRKLDIPRIEPKEEMAEEISPTAQPVRREAEDLFIPHHYGVDRLVVLAKDPHWLYAYWEISSNKYQKFVHRYGEEAWHASRPVLRVYDITGLAEESPLTAHSHQEIFLDPFADNWFIEVGQPDRSFFLELGRLLPDGRYIKLLTSNRVTTPRDSVSQRIDEEWMWIEGIYKMLHRVPYGSGSEALAGKNDFAGAIKPLGISSPGFKQ
ncbi:DUF4912 domain-containing protein [Desulforamulus putei]|uniref:DUF4912 domain-containing protein n=1 Tax=Desulforamulus putei DSM 12395 TaxID=1121429 RepID=A0A1M4YRF3_9FIRM|nr:DUF4912 domain-containing protein [Desulforamulus putei]SHF08340.1 hypothetical protein SAMN02745133_01784 [Desulforamulus putei DSM 12395]